MRNFSRIALLAVCIGVILAGAASAKDLVNAEDSGLGLQGYDPVAFFTVGEPTEGQESITATHRGATYRFASAENQSMFEEDPDKYAPQFGGHCSYGASKGALFPVEIQTWQIYDGRLMLNKNMDVRKLFDQDKDGTLADADENWPGLVEKHGE